MKALLLIGVIGPAFVVQQNAIRTALMANQIALQTTLQSRSHNERPYYGSPDYSRAPDSSPRQRGPMTVKMFTSSMDMGDSPILYTAPSGLVDMYHRAIDCGGMFGLTTNDGWSQAPACIFYLEPTIGASFEPDTSTVLCNEMPR